MEAMAAQSLRAGAGGAGPHHRGLEFLGRHPPAWHHRRPGGRCQGAPVEGAEVELWVFNFATFNEKTSTVTKSDGTFTFNNNPSHNIQVSAEKPGLGRSARLPIRLYFAGEDYRMKEPLQLSDKS